MAERTTFQQVNSFFGAPGQTFEMKPMGTVTSGPLDPNPISPVDSDLDAAPRRFRNTYEDEKDMHRMNKKQELRRNFRFLSIFGYSLLLGNGWVLALTGVITMLTNGGTGGGVWGYLIVICGQTFTTLSMAEMASMAPTAGGQYHWVSEFAPKSCQRVLSYFTGWLCVLGWQTGLCGTAYTGALAVQGIIALNVKSYDVSPWSGVVLTIGIVISTILFNTVLLRKLPTFEGIMVVFHIFAFVAVLVVLWVMGDRAPAKQTFLKFTDYSHWGSKGLAMWIGTLAASGALLGSDCAAHLAEELQEASYVLPRSMVVTAATNYSFTFLMVITFLTVKGGTVDDLLSVKYQPYIKIFENVTQSSGGATALASVIFILLLLGIINQVTTASRQLYAFARDEGLPFSKFLAHVRPGWDVPLNAITVTLLFSILVSFIILGSPVAFFTIGSLSGSALYASYLIVIGSIAYKRWTEGEASLPPSRFSLGKASLPVNLVAIGYLTVQLVFIFFPTVPHPSPEYFNWSLVVFLGVLIIAAVWYVMGGRERYLGPVEYVQKSSYRE